MIITLCGSTRFEDGFHYWNERLSLDGHIVISLAVYPSRKPQREWYTPKIKARLDDLHKWKIDASDAIFVVDQFGGPSYVGDSTRSEIAHAEAAGKPVFYASRSCGYLGCDDRLRKRPPCDLCYE